MDRVVLEGRELVPLRIGFDVVIRGYRRDQVKRFVRESEAETRLLTADRDAAVARAEELADTVTFFRAISLSFRLTMTSISTGISLR